jgi:hypothetical protein
MQTVQLAPSEWIEQCAQRLHERWHTVAPEELVDAALDIWLDDRLRHMPPAEAATEWLSPLVSPACDSRA